MNKDWLIPEKLSENEDHFAFVLNVDPGYIDLIKSKIANGFIPQVDKNLICAISTSTYEHIEEVINIICMSIDPLNHGEYCKNSLAYYVNKNFFSKDNLASDSLHVYKWLNHNSEITKEDKLNLINRICRWSRFGKGLDLLRHLLQEKVFSSGEIEMAVLNSIKNIQPDQVRIYVEENIDICFVSNDIINELKDVKNTTFLKKINLMNNEDDNFVLSRYQNDADIIHSIFLEQRELNQM